MKEVEMEETLQLMEEAEEWGEVEYYCPLGSTSGFQCREAQEEGYCQTECLE
jgi:hypothetical protein